jgi:hypothetical protein
MREDSHSVGCRVGSSNNNLAIPHHPERFLQRSHIRERVVAHEEEGDIKARVNTSKLVRIAETGPYQKPRSHAFGGAEVSPIARARWIRHEPVR